MRRLLLIVFLIIFSLQIYADEEQMEKLFSTEEETYKITELYNHLQNLKKNKININDAK